MDTIRIMISVMDRETGRGSYGDKGSVGVKARVRVQVRVRFAFCSFGLSFTAYIYG